MESSPVIAAAESQPHAERSRTPSPWPAVALLLLVYANSFVDRQIISLLVMPIRSSLGISDSQFSLLNGLAFALFYATLGIPIARWVDRSDRGVILAIGTAVWSIFTMLCGWATSFGGLFLARMGVGAGEATLVPCIYSLLADYFPVQRRGLAMGIFGSGVYLGMGLALIVGGSILQALGRLGEITLGPLGSFASWQLVFCIVGLPGLLLAALVLLLWEPRRSGRKRALAFMSTATSTTALRGFSLPSARAARRSRVITWRPHFSRWRSMAWSRGRRNICVARSPSRLRWRVIRLVSCSCVRHLRSHRRRCVVGSPVAQGNSRRAPDHPRGCRRAGMPVPRILLVCIRCEDSSRMHRVLDVLSGHADIVRTARGAGALSRPMSRSRCGSLSTARHIDGAGSRPRGDCCRQRLPAATGSRARAGAGTGDADLGDRRSGGGAAGMSSYGETVKRAAGR